MPFHLDSNARTGQQQKSMKKGIPHRPQVGKHVENKSFYRKWHTHTQITCTVVPIVTETLMRHGQRDFSTMLLETKRAHSVDMEISISIMLSVVLEWLESISVN